MASCRVDLSPTALPPPCQLHKTHNGDDDDYDNNDYDDDYFDSTTMPTSSHNKGNDDDDCFGNSDNKHFQRHNGPRHCFYKLNYLSKQANSVERKIHF